MQRTLLVTAVLTFGMVFSLSPAAADPIRITGSVVVDADTDAIVDVQGPQGFHAQFTNDFWLLAARGRFSRSLSREP
jgi:hypothetical protein